MKKIYKLLGFGSLVGLVAFTLSGCKLNTLSGTTSDEKKQVVKVGVIAPLSGPASTYGEDIVNVYKDAVEQFNKTSKDLKIELVIEDGKCEGGAAVNAVQKLVNVDRVPIIIGGICSSETLAAGKIANSRKVVMLSPTASAPAISKIGPYMFRFWNDAQAIKLLANYLNKKYENIAIFDENTDYAKGLYKGLKENFKGNVVFEQKFQSDEKDFNLLVNKLLNFKEKVEAIILITQTEATTAGLIKALKKNGLLDDFKGNIYGFYLFSSQAFLKQVLDLAQGLIEVQLDKDSILSSGKKFIDYFKKKYTVHTADIFIPLEKEVIELVIQAIKDGMRTSEDFKKYFESINKDHPRDGYFGKYYFDKNGDAVGLKFMIQRILDKNGKAEVIYK